MSPPTIISRPTTLIPLRMPRGAGKTFTARAWGACVARYTGASNMLIASSNANNAAELRQKLRDHDHALFERFPLHAVAPQRDEFTLRGRMWEAAICEDIDFWPVIDAEPQSVLLEEIVTRTRGPILLTFTDETAPLVKRLWGAHMKDLSLL